MFSLLSRMTILGSAIFVVGLAQSLEAKEGFSTSLLNAPNAVVSAWGATFAVLTQLPTQYEVGTAFLVAITDSQTSKQLYFLTANHVLTSSCQEGQICPSTSLIRDLNLDYGRSGATLEPIKELEFNRVEIVSRSTNPDLALLRVTVLPGANQDLKPILLPTNCGLAAGQPLYSIGFPATADRTNANGFQIMRKDDQTKRWSQGIFVTLLHDGAGNGMKLYVGSTTDALGGSSGGPIVDAAGEVVSMTIKSASVPSNQFQYIGVEDPAHRDWQTLGLRCEVLQAFKTYPFDRPTPSH